MPHSKWGFNAEVTCHSTENSLERQPPYVANECCRLFAAAGTSFSVRMETGDDRLIQNSLLSEKTKKSIALLLECFLKPLKPGHSIMKLRLDRFLLRTGKALQYVNSLINIGNQGVLAGKKLLELVRNMGMHGLSQLPF